MVTEWIEPIYDRKYWDVQEVQYDPEIENPKGCVNYNDLNRIENNTQYVLEYMLEQKIIISPPQLRIKTNWNKTEIPIRSETDRIIENVKLLCELSNPAIKDSLPTLRKSNQWTYSLVNNIEKCLDIMHIQPPIPAEKFLLTIINGIIQEYNNDRAYIEEDEVVTIIAKSSKLNDVFVHWTGEAEDLQYVDDIEAIKTTFTGQYRDVTLTATFQNMTPRNLNLHDAYISLELDEHAESGPTSGTFYPGDEVMIIANRAPKGKKFYEWLGTQEAIDNMSYNAKVSTAVFIMPDCDVELYSNFIEAGQHEVTIINGEGSGWYSYGEIVLISANVPNKHTFDNWSGDTNYLDSINVESTSFVMKDENLVLRANFKRSLKEVKVRVIDGLARTLDSEEYVEELENVKEGTVIELLPVPPDSPEPPEGEDPITYALDYWQVGETTFEGYECIVGDINATIVGHYAPQYTVYVRNTNNDDTAFDVYEIVENHTLFISKSKSKIGDYVFDCWKDYDTGEVISENVPFNLPITKNMDIIAIYKYQPTPLYIVTIENIDDSGFPTDYVVQQEHILKVSTAYQTRNSIFIGWSVDNRIISTSIHLSWIVHADTTIVANYRPKQTYTLSIYNGHFIDETTSKLVKELDMYEIIADDPPEGKEFSKWELSNCAYFHGNEVYLLNGNGSAEAIFSTVHDLEVRLLNGDVTHYTVKENDRQSINSGTYTGYKFVNWEVLTGDGNVSNIYNADTKYTMGTTDTIIQANYEEIQSEYHQISIINGRIYVNDEWVTSATVLHGTEVTIQSTSAPRGQVFSQWEILGGYTGAISEPLAETTTVVVNADLNIKGNYDTPEDEILHLTTVMNKTYTEVYQNPMGYKQVIFAEEPDEGYKFYRWEGSYGYLSKDRHESNNIVNTPDHDITVTATYILENHTIKYHLYMYSAKCLVGIDEITQEEIWATDGEFEENTIVRIKADVPPNGWRFNGWLGANSVQTALIDDLYDDETTITMSNTDCRITSTVAQIDKYTITIDDGQTSGTYSENARVDVYFDKIDTTDEHYEFVKWLGDTDLELYDGGNFNILVPGTSQTPQYIKMPNRRVLLSAEYNTLHHLDVINGVITSSIESYFMTGTIVTIQANTPLQGYRFDHWAGDVNNLANVNSSTTTVTIGLNAISVYPVYVPVRTPNNICYSAISLKNSNTVTIQNLTVISGTVDVGCLITDSIGHVYVVDNVNNEVVSITRLTKANRGGNVYV